jgi:hypothetical protein
MEALDGERLDRHGHLVGDPGCSSTAAAKRADSGHYYDWLASSLTGQHGDAQCPNLNSDTAAVSIRW